MLCFLQIPFYYWQSTLNYIDRTCTIFISHSQSTPIIMTPIPPHLKIMGQLWGTVHVCKKALPVCVLPEPTINCPPLYYRSSLSTAPLHVCLCVLPKSTMNCTLCTVWASYQLPLCTCVRGHHLESGCSAFSSVLPVVTIDCPFCTACPHHQPPHLYCLFPSWIASLCNACPHHQLPPFLLAVPIIKCTLCNAFPCHQLHPVYCLIYYTTDTNLHSNTLSSH